MRRVRRWQGIRSDRLHGFLKIIEERVTGEPFCLQRFNDQRRSYDEIRTVLLAAREIAMAKIEGRAERPVDLRRLEEDRPMEMPKWGRLPLPIYLEPTSAPRTARAKLAVQGTA
jgi:hypothetical protein